MLFKEEHKGTGDPVVLLHGLGANGAVWRDFCLQLADRPGPLLILDLPGHGRSSRVASYSLPDQAAHIAAAIPARVHIVGHSLGGALGFLLASGEYGVEALSLFAFGVKLRWTDEERVRMGRVPQVRSFPTREQAVERFLLVSGLTNLVDPIHPAVTAGIVEENGQFRLAADPLTTLSSGESIEAAIMSCRSRSFPFRLAGGENDPIAPFGDMRELDRQAVCFPACGHNAHVEKPVVVAQAYLRYRGLADS